MHAISEAHRPARRQATSVVCFSYLTFWALPSLLYMAFNYADTRSIADGDALLFSTEYTEYVREVSTRSRARLRCVLCESIPVRAVWFGCACRPRWRTGRSSSPCLW